MMRANRILCALGAITAALILAACGTIPSRAPPEQKRGGGYYKDDGPGNAPPGELAKIPDATPREEPLLTRNNRPYRALGKTYTPLPRVEPFRQRGVASWYGRRFHGRRTASGEPYNMYAMSAAHPTLPLPSYARVTSLENGRSVVVRVNDRGPFLRGRVIDLSYAAAWKLGYINKGSTEGEIEQILPDNGVPPRETEPLPDEGAPEPVATPGTERAPESAPAMDGRAQEASAHETEGAPGPYQDIPGQEAGATQNPNTETVPGGQRLFLQLGVFASRENAENFRARISAQAADLAVNTELLDDNGYFRIYAGPYASPADAYVAAERIGKRLNIQPFIVPRDAP
jgi:rare lipoprotein A